MLPLKSGGLVKHEGELVRIPEIVRQCYSLMSRAYGDSYRYNNGATLETDLRRCLWLE